MYYIYQHFAYPHIPDIATPLTTNNKKQKQKSKIKYPSPLRYYLYPNVPDRAAVPWGRS